MNSCAPHANRPLLFLFEGVDIPRCEELVFQRTVNASAVRPLQVRVLLSEQKWRLYRIGERH